MNCPIWRQNGNKWSLFMNPWLIQQDTRACVHCGIKQRHCLQYRSILHYIADWLKVVCVTETVISSIRIQCFLLLMISRTQIVENMSNTRVNCLHKWKISRAIHFGDKPESNQSRDFLCYLHTYRQNYTAHRIYF